jgi:hypothetical protein
MVDINYSPFLPLIALQGKIKIRKTVTAGLFYRGFYWSG